MLKDVKYILMYLGFKVQYSCGWELEGYIRCRDTGVLLWVYSLSKLTDNGCWYSNNRTAILRGKKLDNTLLNILYDSLQAAFVVWEY